MVADVVAGVVDAIVIVVAFVFVARANVVVDVVVYYAKVLC